MATHLPNPPSTPLPLHLYSAVFYHSDEFLHDLYSERNPCSMYVRIPTFCLASTYLLQNLFELFSFSFLHFLKNHSGNQEETYVLQCNVSVFPSCLKILDCNFQQSTGTWVFFLPGLQSRNHVFQICVNPKDGGMEDVCGMFHKHTDDECYSDLQN